MSKHLNTLGDIPNYHSSDLLLKHCPVRIFFLELINYQLINESIENLIIYGAGPEYEVSVAALLCCSLCCSVLVLQGVLHGVLQLSYVASYVAAF